MNLNNLNPVVYAETDINEALDKKIRENLCINFPHSSWYFKDHRGWKGSFPSWNVIIIDDLGEPIAYCGVIQRIITINETNYLVFGIQNVYVTKSYRNNSLSKKILVTVEEEALLRGCNFGLLFARSKVEGLYRNLGWIKKEEPVIFIKDEKGETKRREFVHDSLYFKPLKTNNLPSGIIYFNGSDW